MDTITQTAVLQITAVAQCAHCPNPASEDVRRADGEIRRVCAHCAVEMTEGQAQTPDDPWAIVEW